jgi:hypothetical protein
MNRREEGSNSNGSNCIKGTQDWPHARPHRLVEPDVCFLAVTPAWVKTTTSFKFDEIARKDGDL